MVKSTLVQLKWFVLVGGVAALTHLLSMIVYVEKGGVPVFLANILAFFTAFTVSYVGHKNFTFKGQVVSHRHAMPRFYMTALLGFALNNVLFFVAYQWMGYPYIPALILVLVIVALVTFILSKFWSFRGQ